MLLLYTFSAEDCAVIWTVEVFDSILVSKTQFLWNIAIFIFKCFFIEVSFRENLISLNYLVENIDVERKFLYCLNIFN
jgi:hypothetical protein